MSQTGFDSCSLPAFPRELVIDKGREGRFHVSISRNGYVLLSPRGFLLLAPFAAHEVHD